MQIPIENIYYLLSYAWNKLDEKERVDIAIDDKTTLLDMLTKLLINASKHLLKQGLIRRYIAETQMFAGIKGKLEISQTLKSNLLHTHKTICTYDELSYNATINQVLFSTIDLVIKTKGIDPKLKIELFLLKKVFPPVDQIILSSSVFSNLRYSRQNKSYIFVMNICELIFDSILPSENKGEYRFTDFTRDERKMASLFESFVRNFYTIEQKKFEIVKRENIKWKFKNKSIHAAQYLPLMQTDISLENEKQKIIIDAKYHRDTVQYNYQKEKVKSANLYQLFSYLLNQENGTAKTIFAKGILLYPTVEKEYDLEYQYCDHSIEIRTVNLNMNWIDISKRLKNIIGIGDGIE